jgi:hypothetical protein
VFPSRASGNACGIDGSNGVNGIGNGFRGNSVRNIGWSSKCGGPEGNAGFNPPGDDTAKNRATGFINLLRNNWLATLRQADDLADDCSNCECDEIAARIVFTSDDPRYTNATSKFGAWSAAEALEISGLRAGTIKDLRNTKANPTDTPVRKETVHFTCAKTKKSEAARIKKEARKR